MQIRRSAIVTLSAVALTFCGVATAPAAYAATPHCHATSFLHEGSEYNEMPTATPNDWNWRCLLTEGDGYAGGDQQHAVWVLQRALIQCYGQNLGSAGADGKYGTRTAEGVRNVQRFHNQTQNAGLAVDGQYGPNTAYYMEFVNTQNRCWTLS
ncbi:hypothetical protein BN159_5055 [Streptomyces davaonensis JCM 4913]|uniref:Peptidoglycan binding-like domain-containing protein n=1 Tax=Streptomyces davaonensis (strain DSM 101723 / JCM 4913 / KCC S-0913 / 768) TaxID=1214101 RepID=K4R9S8_STRDJ|nr:peptidoglycan-binding domain-containing protein [Streptomyces davaonensis]CCK29434.1 hypothetical protein BN159_5055 [Streptomyces davaonensis JCM 4913]